MDKRRIRSLKGLALLIAVVLLALAGCGPPPDTVATQLVDAVNAQDLDGALSLFAREAMVSVGDSPSFSGQAQIQTWLERLFAENVRLDPIEVLAQGEDRFLARYALAMDSTGALGVESLEGSGELAVREGKITALSFRLSEASRAELLRAMLQAGSPVLSYAVHTDPDPLRASPGGAYEPNLGSLTILISNESDDPVQVQRISFRLPEGSSARDLTHNITGVNSEAPDYWPVDKGEGRFTLEPELVEDGLLDPGEGLFLVLSEIEINDQPGVWSLEIFEETDAADTDVTTGAAAIGSMAIPLVKLPFALHVSDLVAEPLVIEPGGSTTLSWAGSDGASYRLYDGRETVAVDHVDSRTIENLTETTTFYLTATLVGAEDRVPVIRERTVTVKPSE